MSQDFNEALLLAMKSEVGPKFNPNHPACVSGIVKTKEDKQATGDVNVKGDKGGATRFGVAKTANPDVDISKLTYTQASEIYYNKYWLANQCDKLPYPISAIYFDACVNHGGSRAIKFLQQCLNLTSDGVLGPVSLAKVQKVCSSHEAIRLLANNYINEREKFFRGIVERDSSQQKFLNGWLNRCKLIRDFISKF